MTSLKTELIVRNFRAYDEATILAATAPPDGRWARAGANRLPCLRKSK